MNPNKTTPGPGNYEINGHPNKPNAARSVMTPRRPVSARATRGMPGPGQYSPSMTDKKKAPNYGFGSGPKSNKMNKD